MERYFRNTKISNGSYPRMVPCASNNMARYSNVMINNNKRFSVPESMMQVQTMEGIPFVPQPYMRTYSHASPMGDQIHYAQADEENNPNFSGGGFNMYQFNENSESSYSGYENLKQEYGNNGGQRSMDSSPAQYSHQPAPLRPEFHSCPQAPSFHEPHYKPSYPRNQQMEVVEVDAQQIVSPSSAAASTFKRNSVKPSSAISKVKSTKIGDYFSSTRTSLSPSMKKSTLSDVAEVKNSSKIQVTSPSCHGTIVDKTPSELKPAEGVSYKAVLDKQRSLHGSGLHIFTGTVEKVLKWHKVLQQTGVLYMFEVIAKCVNVRSGTGCEKHLLLRDSSGPVLQATYFEIDFLMPDLKSGCTLRVVGQMIGANKMKVAKVREVAPFESASLPRLCAISQHLIGKIHNMATSN